MYFPTQKNRFDSLRRLMVQRQLRERGIRDERLLEAMERVPRHEFVDRSKWDEAYSDHPVPIGSGQTVSQPFIVAEMLRLAELKPMDVVLEVGAGSGYEAAILAEMVSQIYTVERHSDLAATAREILSRLGYSNVMVVTGDGSLGLPEFAPFDAIIVAAAAPRLPEPLFKQLKEGGRLVIPIGAPEMQILEVVRKTDGDPVVTPYGRCSFVPLIGAGF